MAKGHCDHRVVLRDAQDNIVLDLPFANFERAKPVYDRYAAALEEGQAVALQHGARIVLKTGRAGD